MTLEIHAYLAGPDVFFPDAEKIGSAKKEKLAEAGIIGHFPFDNEIPPEARRDARATSNAIGKANEQMMLACCAAGRFGVILLNMEPFHGPSMDVGTSFEAGFMSALAEFKDNILIIGYTSDARIFEDRVIEEIYGERESIEFRNGIPYGPDGRMIEAYGGADNLMVTHAIEKTGGCIVRTFDEAVALAKEIASAKINQLAFKQA